MSDVYIGRKVCGCIVAVTADHADKRTADDVACFIRRGLRVERMTLRDMQALPIGCQCKAAQERMAI